MEKNNYMSVGELAKKMNVSARTLQYYDKENLLSPSVKSEGGRRLYSSKDMVKLHQIISLKSLGFSLSQIKSKMDYLEDPIEFADILLEQANALEEKIEKLKASHKMVELLRSEVLQMDEVDFEKYADIIVNLQMNNEGYWLIKHFDKEMLDYIRSKFDQDSGTKFMEKFNAIREAVLDFHKNKIDPSSDEVQKITKEFWDLVMEFTDGDMPMLPKLEEFGKLQSMDNDWSKHQLIINEYLEGALQIYFASLNTPSNEEVE